VRVALLTYSTKPRGGVVHTLALAEALAAQGEQVSVVSLGRGGDETFFRPVDPAVDVRIVPFADRPDETVGERILRSIEVLRSSVDPGEWELVHAQDCISANAVSRPVRTVHHLDTFTTPELVVCHEKALRDPVAHICVSDAVAAELRAGWGIDAVVIPNGVDASRFAFAAGPSPGAVAARSAWCLAIGAPYVLAVGGIEPRKGTVDLVEAMAQLAGSHPAVRLVIAGGETLFDYRPYRSTFDARCVDLGVEPLILGAVDHDLLPALVAAAAAFAFPSTKEGFGLAAMEAVAAGVPLVVRDLPVLREVFASCAAFATDPAGMALALAAAIDAPDPARRAAGRSLAAAHSWSAAATAHRAVYERVVRPRGARGGPGPGEHLEAIPDGLR
jgi:glycosyltransferase-like protein